MSAFLSEAWCADAAEAVVGITGARDVAAVLKYTVNKAPDGRVVGHVLIWGGRVAALGSGPPVVGPDIAITLHYDEALAVVRGERSAEVAFMSGAMRLEGAHGVWLADLHELRASVLAALATVTD